MLPILKSEVRQSFSIHIDAGLFQPEDKLVIVQPIHAGAAPMRQSRAGEIALAHLAIAIGIDEPFDGLFANLYSLLLLR
jgi:hypothetical protein